jgi:hypothetical protein
MNIIFNRKRRLRMVPKINPDFTLYSELKATLKRKTKKGHFYIISKRKDNIKKTFLKFCLKFGQAIRLLCCVEVSATAGKSSTTVSWPQIKRLQQKMMSSIKKYACLA